MNDFVADFGLGAFPHIADVSGSLWSRYGVVSQPAFAFIDDDGSTDVHVGILGTDGLTERIDQLIAG